MLGPRPEDACHPSKQRVWWWCACTLHGRAFPPPFPPFPPISPHFPPFSPFPPIPPNTHPFWGEWSKGIVPPRLVYIQKVQNETGDTKASPNPESHLWQSLRCIGMQSSCDRYASEGRAPAQLYPAQSCEQRAGAFESDGGQTGQNLASSTGGSGPHTTALGEADPVVAADPCSTVQHFESACVADMRPVCSAELSAPLKSLLPIFLDLCDNVPWKWGSKSKQARMRSKFSHLAMTLNLCDQGEC